MTRIQSSYGRIFARISLIAACAAGAPACSSDSNTGARDAGSDAATATGGSGAGAGGSRTGAGGSRGGAGGTGSTGGRASGGASGGSAGASGGSAGTAGASGGSAGAGGRPDAGSSTPPDASVGPDAGPGPNDVLCAAGGAPPSPLLVVGTTYCGTGCTTSELAAVDLARGCVLGRSTLGDTDTVPRASNGRGFVVERTNGALDVISARGGVDRRVDLHGGDGGTQPLNPHDVVFVPSVSKAYVSLYAASGIAVVDVASGAVTRTIDLSSLLDPSDADGSVDADVGFYDAVTGRVYFALQRTDLTTTYAPPYQLACPPVPSLLVAIDPATDTLVDANGTAAGKAIELGLVAPADVAFDPANRRALLVANGCVKAGDGGTRRVLGGVEAVNLDTGATSVLYAPASQDFLSHIALLGSGAAVLQAFDATFATLWNRWSPSSSALGAPLSGVPEQAVAEGTDSLVGVTLGGPTRVTRVNRYTVSTQVVTSVVASPWTKPHQAVAGVALVR
jgi:hypothetical protein